MLLGEPFWRSEYFPRFFDPGFTFDFPSAPPGMPAHYSVWEAERCFEWLNRTVRHSEAVLEEFYGTPDPGQFWGIGTLRAEVLWNGTEGNFASKYFARIEMKEGKAVYLKAWLDTLAFYRAAKMQFPYIIKYLNDPKVDKFMANVPERLKNAGRETPEIPDMDPEAVSERLSYNLGQNMCGINRELYRMNETFNPDYVRDAWFIPDRQPWSTAGDDEISVVSCGEREKEAPREFKPRIMAWIKASSPWMYRDTRGVNYPTDDPKVYFSEMHSNGPSCWIGNHCDQGHYHQEYLMVLKFDDAGRELRREEVICPLFKYTSAKLSLPSFPYYY